MHITYDKVSVSYCETLKQHCSLAIWQRGSWFLMEIVLTDGLFQEPSDKIVLMS